MINDGIRLLKKLWNIEHLQTTVNYAEFHYGGLPLRQKSLLSNGF